MTMPKPAIDFHEIDIEEGWEPAPGAAPGVEQKMLSGELDEAAQIGVRTRLIRFLPGAEVADQFVHDYWEEVYFIEGRVKFFKNGVMSKNPAPYPSAFVFWRAK